MSANDDTIHSLIQSGRGDTLEWLPATASQDDIAAALAGMVNAQGGKILFGITPEAQITGVENCGALIDRTLKAALSLSPQLIIPFPRVIGVNGKEIVVVEVLRGMPHIYALNGRYLQRQGTDNIGLDPQALYRLIMERGDVSFETEPAVGATLDDLNWEKIALYIRKLHGQEDRDPQAILMQRGCLVQRGTTIHPTNAGVLLFGKDPQRFVRGADITAVRFAGEAMSDTFNRQDINGTLPDQIQRAETFLVDHMRKDIELKHTMARREQFEYPMEAARELVVNAVAHRDYSIRGDGIRLFMFKNRMDVTSPGKLPGPVTIANIKDERFSRNPVIVQVLSDMGYIERLGYGVDRVIELMKRHGLREPDFNETDSGFRVSLFNEMVSQPEPPAKTFTISVDVPLNPRQEAALEYLQHPENSRITNSELQRLFPDVHAETIRRDLADMVTKNLLTKMGQKRGSYYVLKEPVVS
jgi:ATP-dependent DNA helicase RecG